MEKKASTLEDDDPYRNVYQFLGTVLRGEIPENASPHTTMVVLLLMEDMNRLIQDVKPDQLQACLTTAPGDADNSQEDEELKQKLLSLFKFQRINEFINPLGVSSKASEKVHEHIFKSWRESDCQCTVMHQQKMVNCDVRVVQYCRKAQIINETTVQHCLS